jgi:hypothetical protein
MTLAAVDRLVHHSTIVGFTSERYRRHTTKPGQALCTVKNDDKVGLTITRFTDQDN